MDGAGAPDGNGATLRDVALRGRNYASRTATPTAAAAMLVDAKTERVAGRFSIVENSRCIDEIDQRRPAPTELVVVEVGVPAEEVFDGGDNPEISDAVGA